MVGYPALENLRKNGALRQFSAKATIPYFDPAAVETASFLGTGATLQMVGAHNACMPSLACLLSWLARDSHLQKICVQNNYCTRSISYGFGAATKCSICHQFIHHACTGGAVGDYIVGTSACWCVTALPTTHMGA